jgi:hypothetical protein
MSLIAARSGEEVQKEGVQREVSVRSARGQNQVLTSMLCDIAKRQPIHPMLSQQPLDLFDHGSLLLQTPARDDHDFGLCHILFVYTLMLCEEGTDGGDEVGWKRVGSIVDFSERCWSVGAEECGRVR